LREIRFGEISIECLVVWLGIVDSAEASADFRFFNAEVGFYQ
jgi:hypothetical protein